MFGGNRETKKAAPAPIVISHVIGDLYDHTVEYDENESVLPIRTYLVTEQGVYLIDLPTRTEPVQPFLDRLFYTLQKKTSSEPSNKYKESTSWMGFLEVRSIQVFSSQDSKNLHLTFIRHCSGL